MIEPIAVLALISVAAAGHNVSRQPTAAQLVEGRELGGRRHESGSMRQEKTEPLGDRCSMSPDQKPVRRIRKLADLHPVEAGPLVDARRLRDRLGSKAGPQGRVISEETRGAIQPIISTGMATPRRAQQSAGQRFSRYHPHPISKKHRECKVL
jgi:hypothetical protein